MDSNYLCIIDGDYKVYKTATRDVSVDGSSSNSNKIIHLVETYQENLNRINSDESFTLVQSKDGNELFANMLKSFGISSPSIEQGESSSNSAMAEKILSEFASATTTSGLFDRISHYTVNSTLAESPSYIAFIVADFDSDHDPVFARLEDVQFKLTNLASAVASSSAAAALASLSVSSFNFAQTIANCSQLSATRHQKRFLILGWPIVYHCIKAELSLISATEVERPLYCKLMSGCVLCFTGFRKENKPVVSTCIRLAHYMGASVRKEYNKKITHLIVKSTLSTKFKTAHNIGKVHLLTEDWIFESWKHRNEVDFNVNSEEFLKKFGIKALYSLSIAFYGFTPEEAAHMREVTIEHGGTPATGTSDPECTHIVVDDQGIKRMPCLNGEEFGSSSGNSSTTPPRTSSSASSQQQQRNDASIYVDLKSPPLSSLVSAQPKAAIVRAEWFWASIQMCCRASEVLYEYNMNSASNTATNNANVNIEPTPQGQKHDPPTKRMKLSRENLLADNTDNSPHMVSRHIDSPDTHHLSHHHAKKKSANNLITNLDYDSPLGNLNNTNKSINRLSTDRLLNGTTSRNNMSNNNLSTSASLLDATTDDAMSIDSPFESKRENSHGLLNSASSNGATGGNNSKKVNKRFQRIYELCETEKRFVTILHTIINVFKEPIELPGQAAGPILDPTEVKEIFGNLPPIYETHCTIKDRLERLTNRMHNDESVSVGEIYLDNADALLKIYPPFLNFYEKTKEAIIACDRNKPRFHAFLKIAQSRPECGRQTLIELLIRPVQRLPSTLLLLDDILKDTPKTHRDHDLLSRAISCLKELMTHINEDKRKTDNHMTMFNLVNDIDNCPPNLLSSHRNFLKKLYVIDLSNDLFKKGSQLALFLFSDCLEICKPKFKVNPARSSPTSNGSSQASKQRNGGSPPAKLYKHVALFPLNNITKVCDILQNNEETDLFGFLYRVPGEKDKFYYFKVMGGTGSGSNSNSGSGSGFASHISTMTLNQLPATMAASSTASAAAANTSNCNNSNYISSSRSYTYSLAHTSTMTLGNVSMAAASSNATSLYTSTTNLNFLDDMPCQALLERKEFMKLLAQGICNVKCITEYDNILCMIEAKQLQIDLNESGNLRKLDAVKSYARRVTRAFSFNDTPNRIRKTISSVFRSPFQSSSSNSHYGTHHPYQQTLGHQPSSRLASLASLQLTPTLTETKRKLMHTLKSTSRASSIANESTSTLNGHAAANLLRQQTCSTINVQNQYSSAMNGGMSGQMTCSSLLSLDACINEDRIMPPPGIAALSHMEHSKPIGGAKVKKSSSENEHDRERRLPDITNINLFGSTSGLKRQFS